MDTKFDCITFPGGPPPPPGPPPRKPLRGYAVDSAVRLYVLGRKNRRADLACEKLAAPTSRAKKSARRLPYAKKKSHVFLIFYWKTVLCVFRPFFEELGLFGRHWQILHEISLRAISFSSKSELSSGISGCVKVYYVHSVRSRIREASSWGGSGRGESPPR